MPLLIGFQAVLYLVSPVWVDTGRFAYFVLCIPHSPLCVCAAGCITHYLLLHSACPPLRCALQGVSLVAAVKLVNLFELFSSARFIFARPGNYAFAQQVRHCCGCCCCGFN